MAWNFERILKTRTDQLRFIELGQAKNVRLVLARGAELDMSTPGGRLLADILSSIARNETEVKSERQARANRQKAEAGLPHVTHRPFGYEVDGMTQVPNEVEALRQMHKMTVAGYGYQAVAYWLNENGYRTADCNLFYAVSVRRLLMRPRYVGIREYLGQTFPAQWPAVFTMDEFDHLRHIIRSRSERSAGRPKARKFLLTGLLYCGKCQQPVTGRNAMRPGGKREATYICLKIGHVDRNKACGGISRGAVPLDDYVRGLIIERLDTPDLGKLLVAQGQTASPLQTLLSERQAKEARKVDLADDYGDGTLTKAEYVRQKARIETAIQAIDEQLDQLHRESSPLGINPGERVADAWDSRDDGWRRRLVDLLIKRIELLPSTSKYLKKNEWYETATRDMFRFKPSDIVIEWRV